MINARAISRELQDQVLNTFRKGQGTVSATVRTWAHATQAVRSQIPNLPVPTIRLHDVTDRLPSPKALASSTQALAEQLMAAQHKLTGQAVRSAAPLLSRWVPANQRPGTATSAPVTTRPESATVAKPEPGTIATAESATVAKPEPGNTHTGLDKPTTEASPAAARPSTTADAAGSTESTTTAGNGTSSARSAATRAAGQKTAAKRPSAAKNSSGTQTRATRTNSAANGRTKNPPAKNPRTPGSQQFFPVPSADEHADRE